MKDKIKVGDIVRGIMFNNLYQVIGIDRKGRIICDPITQRTWKKSFVFHPKFLRKEMPILCHHCTPWNRLRRDIVITQNRWVCEHKFVEFGYQLYSDMESCPMCLLLKPHHDANCLLVQISRYIIAEPQRAKIYM